MCEKCDLIDQMIARYALIARDVGDDQSTFNRIDEAIFKMTTQKAGNHLGEERVGWAAVVQMLATRETALFAASIAWCTAMASSLLYIILIAL